MKKQTLFRELGKYYDLIFASKDYAGEAEKIKQLIIENKKSSGNELLEVACGTGRYLAILKNSFFCTGSDINDGVLDIAKKNVEGVTFNQTDMVSFNLSKQFDVVICLFGSIGYVKTYANLKKTIQNFAAHTKEGGVLIIEPWCSPNDYKTGTQANIYAGQYVNIARIRVSKQKESLSVINMHYLISENNQEPQYFRDRHELGLFETEKTARLLENAGFQTKFIPDCLIKGKGLFICIKN